MNGLIEIVTFSGEIHEAMFHVDESVDRRHRNYWETENSKIIAEKPLHSRGSTVWATIGRNGIVTCISYHGRYDESPKVSSRYARDAGASREVRRVQSEDVPADVFLFDSTDRRLGRREAKERPIPRRLANGHGTVSTERFAHGHRGVE